MLEIQVHRHLLLERTKAVQGTLGFKLKMGFTCKSRDYHTFLKRLAPINDNKSNSNSFAEASLLPMLEPVQAVVEAESTCRRAIVTNAGHIRLGAGMSKAECIESITRLSVIAREKSVADKAAWSRCKDAMSAVERQLGLLKVYRTGAVSNDELLNCLSRFLTLAQQQDSEQRLCRSLRGNSWELRRQEVFVTWPTMVLSSFRTTGDDSVKNRNSLK